MLAFGFGFCWKALRGIGGCRTRFKRTEELFEKRGTKDGGGGVRCYFVALEGVVSFLFRSFWFCFC